MKKKKSSFDNHWRELRSQPKWRTPTTSASSKRTKLSSSGAYSSEGNNDTPTSDEFELIRPTGTKATKRKGKGNGKGKGKRKATAAEVEKSKAFEVNDLRRITIMETVNEIRQKEIETRQRELEEKQAEMDLKVILADTEKMTDVQRKAHAIFFEKILARN
ncbi:uncharacterized protein LOC108207263 [Daucus carota subsp. sativus]|uniref:uncharacterized protein LOC108207263 n=1 Tax=Daucus carota subsp. sativus TaxID=79200 RepID=UPI0007EF4160|nr:PREDICTED: uncharacterized protein LOC108207263 [Daucus carota subsp. sativus]